VPEHHLVLLEPPVGRVERDVHEACQVGVVEALTGHAVDILLVEGVLRHGLSLAPHDDRSPRVDDEPPVLVGTDPALARLVAQTRPPHVVHSRPHIRKS
jgi:hypothetical protein